MSGLLSFLELTGQAVVPNALQGYVQGTLDMEQFYLNRPFEHAITTVTPIAAPGLFAIFQPFTGLTVADGETIYVRNLTITFTVPDVARLYGVWCRRRSASGSATLIEDVTDLPSGTCFPTAGDGPQLACAAMHKPLWLRTGEELGAAVSFVLPGGPATSFTMTAHYLRFRL